MHLGGVDGIYIFLTAVPLEVSTVPSSAKQMPEWLLRPWPCPNSSSSLKRDSYGTKAQKQKKK
jgi:hypothetical protein